MKLRTSITLLYFCISSFVFSMDQKLDPMIKKIIPAEGIQQVAIIGNGTVIIHKRKRAWDNEFFTMAINLSTNKETNILKDLQLEINDRGNSSSLVVDDNKEKIMFTYKLDHTPNICVRVYDAKGDIYNVPEFFTQGGWPRHSCGHLSNTLLLTMRTDVNQEVKSYDYVNKNFTTEKNITSFIANNPTLSIIKYLPNNKILCIPNNNDSISYWVYDLNEKKFTQFCTAIKRSTDVEYSLDGTFIAINYNSGENMSCLNLNSNKNPLLCCSCHEIPIWFLKEDKVVNVKIIDNNNDRKNNHKGRCGLAIHPNNRIIARLKNNEIIYCNAYTGTQYDVKHVYNSTVSEERAAHLYTECLSFSQDGTLVAGAFPGACVVFEVPWEILHAINMKKEKLFSIWNSLKRYRSCDGLLPNDIVRLLIRKVIAVSR